MSNAKMYGLVVIGGGPAGYAAAIRAGQLGKKVVCIEKERAGGTCLNWGCIPSKALLKSAQLYQTMQHASDYGLGADQLTFDFPTVMKRSRNVSDQMAKGIEFLFKKNKVEYVVGSAQITATGMVEITEGDNKGSFFTTDKILLATGCKPRILPGLPKDNPRILTSRDALDIKEQPESIVILGAGAIGAEFAYFLNAFGTKVTLVEMQDQVLPVEDYETAQVVQRSFKKSGIIVHTGTKAENIRTDKKGVTVDLLKGEKRETVQASHLLVAVGVTAYTEGLLSPRIKLETDRGYVKVDSEYQASVAGIYAAGDIIGPPWLAHVATFEAIQAVNGIFGVATPKPVEQFPGCTYCQPQVASIGITEAKAKEQGLKYRVGKFPFTASGKAVASNQSEGFVKIITSEEHDEILGAHIVGSEATELIAEYALGMSLEATTAEIHGTIHAHPTLSEALAEAAAAVHQEAIHI